MIDFKKLETELGPDPNLDAASDTMTVAPDDPGIYPDQEEWHPLDDPTDSGPELPEIEQSDSLIAEDLPLPPEIIKGFLHQGLKGVLGSGSKARKTWILLDMAISVASGIHFWKWPTIRGKVLYINFEIPRRFMRKRLKTIREARSLQTTPLLDVWNLRGYAAPLWKLLPQFIHRLKTGAYTLVIIDPIYKSLGGREENAAGDVAEVCNEMERLAVQTDVAVVYAHHFSKGNQAQKDAIDRISGSGVWARDADSLMIMTKHAEEDCYTVETILRNLPEMSPFVVRWQYPLMITDDSLDPSDLKQQPGRKRSLSDEEILSALKPHTILNPISISDLAKLIGSSRRTLSDLLPPLRQKSFVKTFGEGTKSKQFITNEGIDWLSTR